MSYKIRAFDRKYKKLNRNALKKIFYEAVDYESRLLQLNFTYLIGTNIRRATKSFSGQEGFWE